MASISKLMLGATVPSTSMWGGQGHREYVNRVASDTAILEPGTGLVQAQCHT